MAHGVSVVSYNWLSFLPHPCLMELHDSIYPLLSKGMQHHWDIRNLHLLGGGMEGQRLGAVEGGARELKHKHKKQHGHEDGEGDPGAAASSGAGGAAAVCPF